MLKEPFQKAEPIMKQLEAHGYESYLVGGAVRDYLVNRQIGDIDIATNATPQEVQQVFSKTVPVGIEHGTVLVLHNGESFEVTTYRTESDYQDYRHPSEVSFVKDINLDLSRRDFTINAIAMNRRGEILDPFEGKKDLERQLIRTVHSPQERFEEDPLRMLRGVRFISQLNFDMDLDTTDAIKELHHLLNKISVERITDEMMKLFTQPYINAALKVIDDSGMYGSLPIFNENNKLFFELKKIDFNQPLNHPGVMFALFHLLDYGVSLQKWIKTYKVSNQIKRQAIHVVECYNLYKHQGLSDWVLYKSGKQMKDLYQIICLLDSPLPSIEELEKRYLMLPIKSRSDIVITGQDLLQWFDHVKKGKWIGNFLTEIERLIVIGELRNDRHEIESRVREWKVQEKS